MSRAEAQNRGVAPGGQCCTPEGRAEQRRMEATLLGRGDRKGLACQARNRLGRQRRAGRDTIMHIRARPPGGSQGGWRGGGTGQQEVMARLMLGNSRRLNEAPVVEWRTRDRFKDCGPHLACGSEHRGGDECPASGSSRGEAARQQHEEWGDRMDTCFLCRVSGLTCLRPVPSWSYLGRHRDLGQGFWEHSGLRWQSCLRVAGMSKLTPRLLGRSLAPVAGAPLNTFCPAQMDVLPNTLSNFLKKISVPLFTLEQVLTSGKW